jgi:DNA gyrase inhibitor GyrI
MLGLAAGRGGLSIQSSAAGGDPVIRDPRATTPEKNLRLYVCVVAKDNNEN